MIYPGTFAVLCWMLATQPRYAFILEQVSTPGVNRSNVTTAVTVAPPPGPTISNTNPVYCANRYSEYSRLSNMITYQPCIDATNEDVWKDMYYLHRESRYGPSCLEDLLITYKREGPSDFGVVWTWRQGKGQVTLVWYGPGARSGVHEHHHCVCQGSFQSQPEQRVHQTCMGEASYKGFTDVFFDEHHTRLQCSTHMRLWDMLSQVVDSYDGYDCQGELIRLMYYNSGRRDPCHCQYVGPASPHPVSTTPDVLSSHGATSTGTNATTWQTGTSSSTTDDPSTSTVTATYYNTCSKLDTIQDIAGHHQAAHPNATACQSSGNQTSSEALVLSRCNVSHPDTWRQGTNVRAHCGDIPQYTPVATFSHGQYTSHGGVAGIFIGCLATGLKIAMQQCDQVPVIEHMVDGDVFSHDPRVYYTIQ